MLEAPDSVRACGGNRDGWSARPRACSLLTGDLARAASALCMLPRLEAKTVRPGPKRWQWSGRKPSRPKPLDITLTGRPCRQRTLRCSQGWTLKRVRPGPKRWPWSGREPSRPKPLDIKGPIQGLLRLHSRYGPLDCSTAQGGLCHEASAQSVARPNRSSATGAIDNSPGGTLLHW